MIALPSPLRIHTPPRSPTSRPPPPPDRHVLRSQLVRMLVPAHPNRVSVRSATAAPSSTAPPSPPSAAGAAPQQVSLQWLAVQEGAVACESLGRMSN